MTAPRARIIKVYEPALSPMPGDPSALGSLPTGAFQYCEPVRLASAFGWYVFPPKDAQVIYDGNEIFVAEDGAWQPLVSLPFEAEFHEKWNRHCPSHLVDRAPPFLATIFAPGVLQVWSGLLISTEEGWSTHVRGIANADFSSSYQYYEGIVETDGYGPWPLFVNLRLTATNRPIQFNRNKPLFQLQVVPRSAYGAGSKFEMAGTTEAMTDADWQGFSGTIRAADPREEPDRRIGDYAARTRKRRKGE